MIPGQLDLSGNETPGEKNYYSRILLAGDTHTDVKQIEYLFDIAIGWNCQLIFQLGDFGYWPRDPEGKMFIERVSELAEREQIPFYFIDGNHEDHPELRKAGESPDSFWEVYPGLHYAPRGHRWEWRGKRFMSLGGAYSIDKNRLKAGVSWFPQEEIDAEEMYWATRPGEVDILLAHDMPDGIDWKMHRIRQGWDMDFMNAKYPDAVRHQKKVLEIANTVQPDLFIHGHMHLRYSDKLMLASGKMMRVEGINCNGWGNDSWYILDL